MINKHLNLNIKEDFSGDELARRVNKVSWQCLTRFGELIQRGFKRKVEYIKILGKGGFFGLSTKNLVCISRVL